MTYKKIACKLWDLLDDIDTYSDMLKPDINLFYKKAMRKVKDRHLYLGSNGYRLRRRWRRKEI